MFGALGTLPAQRNSLCSQSTALSHSARKQVNAERRNQVAAATDSSSTQSGSPGNSEPQVPRDIRTSAASAEAAQQEFQELEKNPPRPKLRRSQTLRKIDKIASDDISKSVHAVILAGGSSDNPLARNRAMPAIEIGSTIQLIDVPISNCVRAGVNKMYVLTQFNSHTLNTHITNSYPPAVFGGPKKQGFVDVLACHQTPNDNAWYRGSADAVRRNLPAILEQYRGAGVPDELLILSGQALYNMDYVDLIKSHRENDVDITIATHSVGWGQASRRGLTRVDPETGLVTHFIEKPTGSRLESMAHASKHATPSSPFEASMGIYIFKSNVLVDLLHENEDHFGEDAGPDTHFGHDVIPHALREGFSVRAHHFEGYWRELAGLRDFYEANLELATPKSPISIFDVDTTIVSRGKILPPSIIHDCEIYDSLVGEGSVLVGSTLKNCIVGCNSYIGQGCKITETIILGNDNYTNDATRSEYRNKGEAVLGVGDNSIIHTAIIDSNAAIGRNVRITNETGVIEADRSEEGYVVTNGIVVVLKGAVIKDNTKI